MEQAAFILAGFAMVVLGAGMAAYEWSRVRSKRPLFGGGQVVTLYWCAYLALLVLGVTTAVAAVVRG